MTNAPLSRVYPPSLSFSVLQPAKVGQPTLLLLPYKQVCFQFETGLGVPTQVSADQSQRARHRVVVIKTLIAVME